LVIQEIVKVVTNILRGLSVKIPQSQKGYWKKILERFAKRL